MDYTSRHVTCVVTCRVNRRKEHVNTNTRSSVRNFFIFVSFCHGGMITAFNIFSTGVRENSHSASQSGLYGSTQIVPSPTPKVIDLTANARERIFEGVTE
jgi:hypothetical protein